MVLLDLIRVMLLALGNIDKREVGGNSNRETSWERKCLEGLKELRSGWKRIRVVK